jgi:hypothetical protein
MSGLVPPWISPQLMVSLGTSTSNNSLATSDGAHGKLHFLVIVVHGHLFPIANLLTTIACATNRETRSYQMGRIT